MAGCVARATDEERAADRSVMAQPTGNVRLHASRSKGLRLCRGPKYQFEFRWAEGKLDQLPELAAELVHLQVDVIITLAPQATLAAKRATQTIPIVFVAMGDPLASGIVA